LLLPGHGETFAYLLTGSLFDGSYCVDYRLMGRWVIVALIDNFCQSEKEGRGSIWPIKFG
jgi:hypothetical protein